MNIKTIGEFETGEIFATSRNSASITPGLPVEARAELSPDAVLSLAMGSPPLFRLEKAAMA
jgi:hypothetical protein